MQLFLKLQKNNFVIQMKFIQIFNFYLQFLKFYHLINKSREEKNTKYTRKQERKVAFTKG